MDVSTSYYGDLVALVGKLVRIGNSVGIAIRKKDAEEQGWNLQQKVEVVPLKTGRKKMLRRLLGAARGIPPFIRDEGE